MEKTPVIRIGEERHKAKRLTVGAYRQIILLIDEIDTIDQEELKDGMIESIRIAFGLTPAQADQIDAADIIPTFRVITQWAQKVFTEKLATVPNVEGLEATPGQN